MPEGGREDALRTSVVPLPDLAGDDARRIPSPGSSPSRASDLPGRTISTICVGTDTTASRRSHPCQASRGFRGSTGRMSASPSGVPPGSVLAGSGLREPRTLARAAGPLASSEGEDFFRALGTRDDMWDTTPYVGCLGQQSVGSMSWIVPMSPVHEHAEQAGRRRSSPARRACAFAFERVPQRPPWGPKRQFAHQARG